MNRIIKFRAWDEERSEMYYPSSLHCNYKGNTPFTSTRFTGDNQSILMQFTGLYDKNGKEIYEFDVIRQWLIDSIEKEGGYWWIATVEMYKGCFVLKQVGFDYERHKEMPTLLYDDYEDIEIIGNLFQNPELLNN